MFIRVHPWLKILSFVSLRLKFPPPVVDSSLMEMPPAPPESLWIGRDHLTITPDQVVIDAAQEMPDWQVREYQRMPIFLGESKFFLRQKIQAKKPFALRYVLERWPEEASFDAAAFSFTYDEDYVRQRDTAHEEEKRADKIGMAMLWLYPVLGFLWAGTKKKLMPLGFISRSITGVSIFTGLCGMILQGTFLRMRLGLLTLLLGWMNLPELLLLALDYALLGLLLVDSVLRFDQHLKGAEHPWGFGEWMTKPFKKKSLEEEDEF